MVKKNIISFRALLTTLGVAALLIALFSAPGGALAHAKLTSSTPADGSTVPPGLTSVSMTFAEEISLTQSTAQLLDASGAAVSGATGAVDKADRTKLTITTPALGEGKYTVKWHSVTEDDNGIVDGTFAFTVAAGGGTATNGAPTNSGTQQALPATGSGQGGILMSALALCALGLAAFGLNLRRRSAR